MTTNNATIAERIERLPLGGFHRRFIALVSLGNFFDLYDIFIVAYIGAALQQSGFLSLRQFTFFVAAGFLGMFVGTVVFGMGRTGWAMSVYFAADLFGVYVCGCVSPTAGWLIALRFCGVGIGAEIVVIDTYVTEVVPSFARGRYVAITQAGFAGAGGGGAFPCTVPTH
jgi:putative MFS transporter